jgi:hypothetical protein
LSDSQKPVESCGTAQTATPAAESGTRSGVQKRPSGTTHPPDADLPVDFPPIRTLAERIGNLPLQVSSFIGRARELLAP